ncbi:hypothetical protein BH23PLA1_BH23PLA1_26380 [soil metagenome]
MLNRFRDWLDSRTGYKTLSHEALYETIPGGARWRYVFGSALTGVFLIQVFTGLLMMTSYVPSSAHAWGSVWYISNEMTFGWLIRGLHHFGSSAMIILLGLHLIQVLLAGAYRAPREINWWLGMALLFLTLGFSLTGYLLPWDQKGYWATKVATNIAGGTPVMGPSIQRVVVGGSEYGNQTLTRFYGLHVGILPTLFILFVAGHIAMFRKNGVTPPRNAQGQEYFWPKQFFLDIVASVGVVGIILLLVLWEGGANLDAPADPASKEYPARPEWYFLSLFQLLKYFQSPYEIVGTVVVPTVIVILLFLMPLFDKIFPHRVAHFLACSIVFVIVGGAGYFTFEAMRDDQEDQTFQIAKVQANAARDRALQLAREEGVPPDGSAYILRRDPYFHGRATLEARCLSCHYYDGQGQVNLTINDVTLEALAEASEGAPISGPPELVLKALAARAEGFTPDAFEEVDREGAVAYLFKGISSLDEAVEAMVTADGRTIELTTYSKQTASDLKDFGTRDWLRGMLEDPADDKYFGKSPFLTGMKSWKKSWEERREKLKEEQRQAEREENPSLTDAERDERVEKQVDEQLALELDTIADFFEELVIPVEPGTSPLAWELSEAVEAHPGSKLFNNECARCHSWGLAGIDGSGVNAPNLFGWGSEFWTRRMIETPDAHDLYGYLEASEQMPPFLDQVTDNDLKTIYRYLKGDYLPPDDPAPSAH